MKKFNVLIFVFCIFYAFSASAQKLHFSIDDVGSSLKDLTKNEKKYSSLFEQKFFKYLKQLNESYGAKITLYCFCELDGFHIADCTEKFKDEFCAASDWLKFGYHAYDASQAFAENAGGGYEMFVKSVLKFSGSERCISQTVRLDRFSGGRKEIENCSRGNSKCGIKQLLTADDRNRRSYYLENSAHENLCTSERHFDDEIGIEFFASDFRFDDYKNFEKYFAENCKENEIVVFTHEWILQTPLRKNLFLYAHSLYRKQRVKKNILRFFDFAKNNNFEFITEF